MEGKVGFNLESSYLVFGSPIIQEDEIEAVISTLKSGWIGTGPKVHQFEEEIKNYLGVKHAVAVSSCTAGLHLSVVALGIGAGDEVIVPDMTFAATANAVIHSGATPIFVDVDRLNMTLDIKDLGKKINKKTKAIIPVHFAGFPCDIGAIETIAKDHNLFIIHDAAHALETEYKGKKVGSYKDLASFSFYVTKNITTIEGGLVATNNDEIADKIKIFALHGMTKDAWKRFSDDGYKHYQVVYPGFKYNMTDVQASIGLSQFKKIESFAKRRKEIWNIYQTELKNLPLFLPKDTCENSKHAYHLFPIMIDTEKTKITRDQILNKLHKMNIGTGVHYLALHTQPYYRERFNLSDSDFPNSSFISERTLSIPFSAKLTDNDVEDVINSLKIILQ